MATEFKIPVDFLPVDFVVLSHLPKAKFKIDSSLAYDPNFVPLNQRFTRKEIRQNSAGARIRAEIETQPK